MSTSTDFQIVYDGPALQSHEMDVHDLAPALMAVGDLLEETNLLLYGEKSKVYVNVKGSFKTGSFHIDFATAQNFLSGAVDMFSGQSPAAKILLLLGITTVVTDGAGAITKIGEYTRALGGGLIQFILWLKNRNIKKITKADHNGMVTIEIEDGETIVADSKVISLFRNIRIRASLDSIIHKFLSKEGISLFAIGQNRKLTEIKKQDKDFFVTPDVTDRVVEDQIIETTLQAITVSFEEGYKWRFSDGEASFMANVKDEDFITKIQDNKVTFAKGDALKVKLHKRVTLSIAGLKPEHEVLEVLEHFQSGRQIELPFVENT